MDDQTVNHHTYRTDVRSRTGDALPARAGVRPSTTRATPHMQLNQQPAKSFSKDLLEFAGQLPGVVLEASRRAPEHTIGLYLTQDHARGPADAFMLSTEFAHVHPEPDFSLHLTLPEPLRTQALAAGWVEPHPLAGYPTISNLVLLLFAPRDEQECVIAKELIEASWAYAKDGSLRSPTGQQHEKEHP
jgi:hypothetical protein